MRIATIPILLAICNESRIDLLACYELRYVGGVGGGGLPHNRINKGEGGDQETLLKLHNQAT